MNKNISLTVILIFLSFYCHAQELSKNEIKEVTFKIAELIKSNYVLKEQGNSIASNFIKDYNNGKFITAESWKQLDSLMSISLNEISDDDHLYTWHNPEIIHQLKLEEKGVVKKEDDRDEFSFFSNKLAIDSNFGFQKVEITEENIGYIKLSKINISEKSLRTLYSAMEFVKNTKALIIDLRDNSGGGSTVGSVLESFFFENETDLLEFKNRTGFTEITKTVPWLLEKRYTRPLFILINNKTASAAEAFAFTLQQKERAIIVGESSAGAAFMNKYFLVNDHMVVAISNNAPFLPGTVQTWQGIGVKPDIPIQENEAKKKALTLNLRKLEKN